MNDKVIMTQEVTKGLDIALIALIMAVLVALVTALAFAINRRSKFNGENLSKKQAASDTLNRKIYETGTAPLVFSVSNFLYEQIAPQFPENEKEVIDRYEEARLASMNPEDVNFVDMSALPESVDYDQKVSNLVSAHSDTVEHEKNYGNMKTNLDWLNRACWLPITIVSLSLLIHVGAFLMHQDTEKVKDLVHTVFVIGLLSSVFMGYFYLRYKRCEKKLDDFGSEASGNV